MERENAKASESSRVFQDETRSGGQSDRRKETHDHTERWSCYVTVKMPTNATCHATWDVKVVALRVSLWDLASVGSSEARALCALGIREACTSHMSESARSCSIHVHLSDKQIVSRWQCVVRLHAIRRSNKVLSLVAPAEGNVVPVPWDVGRVRS